MKISLIITSKHPRPLPFYVPKDVEVRWATGSKDLVLDKNVSAEYATGDILVFMDDDAKPYGNCFFADIKNYFINANLPANLITTRIISRTQTPFDTICSQDLGDESRVFTRHDVCFNWLSLKRLTRSILHGKKQLGQHAPPPWGIGNGTCFAILKETFVKVGGFNRKRTVGRNSSACEDNDLFYRVLRAGRVIGYASGIVVVHDHGRVNYEQALQRRKEYDRGNLRFTASNWTNPLFWPYILYFAWKSL